MTQSVTQNPVELYQAAANRAKSVVGDVSASQLGNPTPCEKWSVQELLDHILGGLDVQISVMTDGADKAPEAGANSLATYEAGTTKVVEVANMPGMMEKQLQSPFGPITGAGWMMGSFMDTLIHTWDLAKATGQNTDMDPTLAEACYTAFAPQIDGFRGPETFGPAVEVKGTASIQDKLLGIMGRKP